MAFREWKSHVTLALEASNVPKERWYASIIGFLGSEGFKHWQHLEISTDEDARKTPENVFTAFANTLEVSTSHWNYIDEMYSNIWQGEQETTDQLDQHIKMLVERCGYMSPRREDAMPTGATLSCNKTLQGKKVGKIADSSKQNSHFQQVITARKATRSNH